MNTQQNQTNNQTKPRASAEPATAAAAAAAAWTRTTEWRKTTLPKHAVGRFFGKQGAALKELQRSHPHVHFKVYDADPTDGSRVVKVQPRKRTEAHATTITGQTLSHGDRRRHVEAAIQACEAVVHKSLERRQLQLKQQHRQERIRPAPSEHARLVIGLSKRKNGRRNAVLCTVNRPLSKDSNLRRSGAQQPRQAQKISVLAEEQWPCLPSAAGKAKAEVGAKTRAAMEGKIKAEMEAKIKAEMEAKIKAEMEAKIKAEMEAERKAQEEAKIKAELEATIRAEMEAKIRAEMEAERKAQEEAKNMEAKIKADMEAEIKAEMEATIRAEQKLKIPVDMEAELRAEIVADIHAEIQAEANRNAQPNIAPVQEKNIAPPATIADLHKQWRQQKLAQARARLGLDSISNRNVLSA